ncbi:DUF2484 family protein [Salibaculum griseiflavum]|uniref:DUF2484 family protein n=1 Tax=Salibaculum griseiflavum TaxID=1914409 RepID=A0A2V1P7E3_9RHOB|nr:DUF2484 family protein [Salibaculum griseiflavum]PWG17287.1 hypothetical protein DFK10_07845 [Salibaculum griseiflavum]
MTPSLVAAFLWAVAANVLALIPSRDNHWTRAYILIAFGIPLLGWVVYENGPWIGLVVMVAGMSLLRWPVIYLMRWLRAIGRRTDG